MNYKHLTGAQRQEIRESHLQQLEQQHYSALVQRERDQAAGRDTEGIDNLIAQIEAEHKQLVQQQTQSKPRRRKS